MDRYWHRMAMEGAAEVEAPEAGVGLPLQGLDGPRSGASMPLDSRGGDGPPHIAIGETPMAKKCDYCGHMPPSAGCPLCDVEEE